MRTGGMEDAKIMLVHGVPTAMQILAVFLCALPLLPQDDAALTPKLNECRLVAGAKELAPVRAERYEARSEFSLEGWRVSLTPTVAWVARENAPEKADPVDLPKPPPGRELHTLTISGDTAYLTDPEDHACRILRLDLKGRSWLAPWDLSDEALGLAKHEGVRSTARTILCKGSAAFVLRDDLNDKEDDAHPRIGNLVARLDLASGKLGWSRYFDAVPPPSEPGAVLMAPMLTTPTRAWTRPLQFVGEDLLVCAGGSESVLRLGSEKGETKWGVDRLWEYQRGYIGPSVWGHFLDRFGIDSESVEHPERYTPEGKPYYEKLRKEFEDRRRSLNESFTGSIVAGPFVVREQDPWRIPRPRILVVAELAPRDPWAAQLAQHYVYEIDSEGKPCAVVTLPRAALGWVAQTLDDRAVFACAHGAWACVASTENRGESGMGSPGSSLDIVAGLVWYREPVPRSRKSWMSCDPDGDPVALGPSAGLRTAGGGWIEKRGDTLFHFPLSLLDPSDGSAREIELRVPFEGSMSMPSTNYRGDANSLHTWGWRGLALTKLELAADRLLVWLANSKQVWKLEFDAREFVPAK